MAVVKILQYSLLLESFGGQTGEIFCEVPYMHEHLK